MKVVCLSDTHNLHDRLNIPNGDILVYAGDAAVEGTKEELEKFSRWFRRLPHQYKVFVPGNHDDYTEKDIDVLGKGVINLVHQGTQIGNLKIFGSPFRVMSDNSLRRSKRWYAAWSITELWGKHAWMEIPEGLDILITHMPPKNIMDFDGEVHWGSQALLEEVQRAKPKYHIFGHVHDCPGVLSGSPTTFVNVSCCTQNYLIRPDIRVLDI